MEASEERSSEKYNRLLYIGIEVYISHRKHIVPITRLQLSASAKGSNKSISFPHLEQSLCTYKPKYIYIFVCY